VRRSDGSGTTFAFTNHVSSTSDRWKQEVGFNKSVEWPVGVGAKGNNGVAALIDQTPGALGYVEFGYADLTGLPMAALQNKAGLFITPSPESGQAALEGAKLPDNFRLFIPDPPGAAAYPIVTYTWVMVLERYFTEKVSRTIKMMLTYALTEGQQISEELGYLPLPKNVTDPVLAAVKRIGP
jgi:phosphate transport system substrate-binding protein